jgi:hypothetical protein
MALTNLANMLLKSGRPNSVRERSNVRGLEDGGDEYDLAWDRVQAARPTRNPAQRC